MKISWWNIRGFSKTLKHKIVNTFLKEHDLALLALMETKLEDGKLFEIMQLHFAKWKVAHNFDEHEAGRMLILWNPELLEMEMVGIHDQVMHLKVTCKISARTFYVSFVYGLHSIVARRPLWECLSAFGRDGRKPWLVLGDFNNILEIEDRIGGNPPKPYEAMDFQNCCMDLGLSDLPSTGAKYTWSNGKVWSKIDRALSNQGWLMEGFYAMAEFLPPGCASDHSPCVLHLFDVQRTTTPAFMFFNMWADHDHFSSLVEQEWHNELYGTKQYCLCRKLKSLKKQLRALNKKEFSHIAARAKKARAELKDSQMAHHDNPRDSTLLAKVKTLQQQASFLSEAERKFCAQKTKIDFLLRGDKGSKLFHSLIKRNAKRNYIVALVKEDGSTTTSKEEVKQEFLNFYEGLLGTHEDMVPLEAVVMEEGPKVTNLQ